MKKWVLVPALFSLAAFSSIAAINSASQDVLRMVQNGVSETVIDNYVNNSTAAFNLNADDILYLQENGVPQPVISTMISHDNNNNNVAQGQPYDYNQAPPPDQTAQVNPPDAYSSGYVDQSGYSDQSAQVMEVAPDQAPPQVASFYDELRPYGTWIYLQGYGWCWQPNQVRTVANWQPYRDDGNWLYCDDGWYWQSSYNWGWAPFHYGRWWQASCGWVWFPDTVWAPSWVAWRETGDYCGWAPLPPSGFRGYGRPGFHFGIGTDIGFGAGIFTFVHFGDIFRGGYRHHEIPRTQVNQFFNRTRVINNVTIVNNNYARNPGIARSTVQRYTPVRVARVRTSNEDPRRARPGVVRNGSEVAIVRPQRAPTPERTTRIVGHRLPANARSVPATNLNPRDNNERTIRSDRTRADQPRTTTTQSRERERLQTPRTDQTRTYTPRATETPRATTPRVTENPRTSTPRATETRERSTPSVTRTPRPTTPRVETPRATPPSVTETPRPSRNPRDIDTPRVTETPRPNNPRASDVPNPTQQRRVTETPRPSTPRATEVPRSNPAVTDVPNPRSNPRVSETPRPAPSPRVTEVPRTTPTPRPHVETPAPEVHRAFPPSAAPTVREPRATIREPAGARPLPTPRAQPAPPTPHVAVPPPQAHSAPPAARPFSAPGIQRQSTPPPGLQRRDH